MHHAPLKNYPEISLVYPKMCFKMGHTLKNTPHMSISTFRYNFNFTLKVSTLRFAMFRHVLHCCAIFIPTNISKKWTMHHAPLTKTHKIPFKIPFKNTQNTKHTPWTHWLFQEYTPWTPKKIHSLMALAQKWSQKILTALVGTTFWHHFSYNIP